MENPSLYEFIGANRDEIIRRCRTKVATRWTRPAAETNCDHGVPLFLSQLSEELRRGSSQTDEISKAAVQHGHDLLLQGFTVSQVVHDYGDVCQAITELAVELTAPISTDDFRTLNRCLDDAIAGAVTEHAHAQDVSREGKAAELRVLIDLAITAFGVVQTGAVGVTGRTGDLVLRSLLDTRALLDRPLSH
jgi:hypothetical protein